MKVDKFSPILETISTEELHNFVKKVLGECPDFLESIPASASGKYHPPEASEPGGLVWHIIRTCQFANIFFKAYKWDEKSIKADIVLCSLLLHDIGKKPKYDKYWDYVDHPITASKFISKFKNMLPEKLFSVVNSCILHHMGPWTPKRILKPIEQYTQLELLVYQSDYLASQKHIQFIKG